MDILNINISLSVFLVIVQVLAMISLYIYYLFNHLKNVRMYKYTSCLYIDIIRKNKRSVRRTG